MARKRPALTEVNEDTAEVIAERQAAADRELLAQMQAKQEEVEEPKQTILDAYASIVAAVVEQKRTYKPSLTETTLVKLLEITLQWDAYNFQRKQAEQQRFDPSQFIGPNENGEPPAPDITADEYLTGEPDAE